MNVGFRALPLLLTLAVAAASSPRASAQSLDSFWNQAQGIVNNFRSSFRPSWQPNVARQRAANAWWAVHEQQQSDLERAQQQQQDAIWRQQQALAKAREAAERQRQLARLAAEQRSNDWFKRGQADLNASQYQDAINDFRQAIQNWPDGTNSVFAQNLLAAIDDQKRLDRLHENYREASAQIAGPGTDDTRAAAIISGPGTDDDEVTIAVAPDGSKLTAPRSIAGFEQKGFDAIKAHDWPVALAWYETALQKDRGNVTLANIVDRLRDLEKRDGDPYNYFSGAGVLARKPTTGAQDTAQIAKLLYDVRALGGGASPNR